MKLTLLMAMFLLGCKPPAKSVRDDIANDFQLSAPYSSAGYELVCARLKESFDQSLTMTIGCHLRLNDEIVDFAESLSAWRWHHVVDQSLLEVTTGEKQDSRQWRYLFEFSGVESASADSFLNAMSSLRIQLYFTPQNEGEVFLERQM